MARMAGEPTSLPGPDGQESSPTDDAEAPPDPTRDEIAELLRGEDISFLLPDDETELRLLGQEAPPPAAPATGSPLFDDDITSLLPDDEAAFRLGAPDAGRRASVPPSILGPVGLFDPAPRGDGTRRPSPADAPPDRPSSPPPPGHHHSDASHYEAGTLFLPDDEGISPAGAGESTIVIPFQRHRTEVLPVVPDGEPSAPAPKRRLTAPLPYGDRIFRSGAWSGGLSVLVIMAIVGLFLAVQAGSALRVSGIHFLTTSEWQPDIHKFGIKAVLFYNVAISAVALVAAVPLATGTALFITEIAPRALRSLFVAMVDLMAAVPSIVYGLWGLFFLQGRVIGLSRWLSTWLGWIPLFKVDGTEGGAGSSESLFTASTFIAGLVVALMVIPISCSIMREVFSQAPPGEREGAYALGATRWGVIRTVVLPFGRGGMIGAVMLGLGRALGETIAVYLIISPVFEIKWHLLQSGSNSVAALIVLRQGDASGFGLSALMAAGLALFMMTLVVNFGASAIVARSRSGAES